MSKFDAATIDRLVIGKGGVEEGYEKSGEEWVLSGTKGIRAKKEIINGFLDELEASQNSRVMLVSANPAKKGEFRTDESGIKVVLSAAGREISGFVAGKTSPDFLSIYVSKIGSAETYSWQAGLSRYLSQADWKDDSIFSTDKDKIAKIRFQYPRSSFTIEKQDGKWQGRSPWKFAVKQDKLDRLAGLMATLRAVEIPAQSFAGTGLEKHLIIVQATGEGIDNTIMIGDSNGKGSYFAKRGDSDNIYLISKQDRDELDKSISQLK